MTYRQFRRKQTRRSFFREAPGIVFGLAVVAAAGIYSMGDLVSSVAATAQGCGIKGNVSFNSRERIFHVPGQEDYDATKINSRYGERWFCSEAEALAAGWRKARN